MHEADKAKGQSRNSLHILYSDSDSLPASAFSLPNRLAHNLLAHQATESMRYFLPPTFFLISSLLCFTGCERSDDSSYAPTQAHERVAFPVSYDPVKLTRFGPNSCTECHAQQVADWKKSHHAHANRPVSLELDRAAFTPSRRVQESGVTYELSIEDDKFLLSVLSEGEATESYELYGVIGHTPVRQYLAKFPGNKFQTISASYDVLEDRWVDVYAGEDRLPGEWGHWTGQGMNWNANCAYCHTTDYKKNYDFESDTYTST